MLSVEQIRRIDILLNRNRPCILSVSVRKAYMTVFVSGYFVASLTSVLFRPLTEVFIFTVPGVWLDRNIAIAKPLCSFI